MKITWSFGSSNWGAGFTVIVNVCGVPSHPSKLGVTVTVDVIASFVVLVAVTFILPEPELDSPIAELVLVHKYVVSPPVLSVVKLILILSLLHQLQYLRVAANQTSINFFLKDQKQGLKKRKLLAYQSDN